MRRLQRVVGLSVALGAALASSAAHASWCDLVFQDVVGGADVVVLVQVQKTKGKQPTLRIVEVLKGDPDRQVLRVDPEDLRSYGLKNEDQLFLALTRDNQLISTARSMGVCTAISVLPIRGGKLRSRDRVNYDSRSGSMTLDQLREDLVRRLASETRVSGAWPSTASRSARP